MRINLTARKGGPGGIEPGPSALKSRMLDHWSNPSPSVDLAKVLRFRVGFLITSVLLSPQSVPRRINGHMALNQNGVPDALGTLQAGPLP